MKNLFLATIIFILFFLIMYQLPNQKADIAMSQMYYKQAVHFEKDEEYNNAIKSMKKAVFIQPSKRNYSYLGALSFFNKDLKNAEKSYLKALNLDSKSIPTIESLFVIYELSNKPVKSINLINRSIHKNKLTSERLFLMLGGSYLKIKDYNKALQAFKDGISKYPKSIDLVFSAAIANYFKKDDKEMHVYLNKLKTLDEKIAEQLTQKLNL